MEEHLYNVRAFARYKAVDRAVMEASPLYNDLPADSARQSRTRKAPTVFSTTSDDTPKKKRFVFDLVSSSDDDSDDDDDAAGAGDDS